MAAIDDEVLGLCEAEGVPVFPLPPNAQAEADEERWTRAGRIAEWRVADVKLRVRPPPLVDMFGLNERDGLLAPCPFLFGREAAGGCAPLLSWMLTYLNEERVVGAAPSSSRFGQYFEQPLARPPSSSRSEQLNCP